MKKDTFSKKTPYEDTLPLLQEGEIYSAKLMPWGSNYTFLVSIQDGSGSRCDAVYKPQAGERPLRDFPRGTLYKREYATYVVGKALGWPSVPPTVIREGPHGVGSVQLYVESEPGANYFSLREDHVQEFQRIAAFDCLVNNADRKAGHCLMGRDGRVWVIDHGLTFHPIFKMRTVIWDFAGQRIPEGILEKMDRLRKKFNTPGGLKERLRPLLLPEELEALRRRLDGLLAHPVFPLPGPQRSVPWPLF